MFKSMFARLFSLFMAVILLVLILMSVFTYWTVRDIRVNSRMDELKKEAREIAYLASQTRYPYFSQYFTQQSPSEQLLQWKATQVYNTFRAFIAVVNRQGQKLDNIPFITQSDPDFAVALDEKDINRLLLMACQGQEVYIRTESAQLGGLVFIVAVPWIENDQVLGAVFIHTSAQVIEASYASLIWQVLAAMGLAAMISGLLIFWYVKRLTRPLTGMAGAAKRMAQGDFSVRAENSRVNEIDELAQSFNFMAEKVGELEASRREFVANVSHELRSPITSISGYIEGMRDGTIPGDEQHKYLRIVSDETRRLSKLISDLLSLSRMEQKDAALRLTAFDINELIRRVLIRRMNDIDRKALEMDVRMPEEALIVHADADRIEQVIVNLMDNAIKFTREHGRITLETQDIGKEITVTVSDNGEGILPGDREHIFERFYTADKAHTAGKGTGLGLSICRVIMEQHGKSIALLPAEEGAAFRIFLDKGEMGK